MPLTTADCPIGGTPGFCSAGTCDACRRERTREAFDAMEREMMEEYQDYVRRCGGAPISPIRPD